MPGEQYLPQQIWSVMGTYYALLVGNPTKEEIIKRFQNLMISEQFWITYCLSLLKSQKEFREQFIPSYNSTMFRLYGDKKTELMLFEHAELFHTVFLDILKENQKQQQLYEYAQKCYAVYKNFPIDRKNQEGYHLARLLQFSANEIFINKSNSKELKAQVINFLIEVINETESYDVKTILTISFFKYFSPKQLQSLKTTEYALGFIFPLTLASGTLKMYFPVIFPILRDNQQMNCISENIKDIRLWIPATKNLDKNSILSWVSSNLDTIQFDPQKKQYLKIP